MDETFSQEQLRRIVSSDAGRALLTLLRADGGARMQQAAEAVRQGDHVRAQQILQPVLQTEQTQALLRALHG